MAIDLLAPLKKEAREILLRIAANPTDKAIAAQYGTRLRHLAGRIGVEAFQAIAGEAQEALGKAIAAAVPEPKSS